MPIPPPTTAKDMTVVCKRSDGESLRGVPQRLDPHNVVFEVYAPELALHASEVLAEFQLLFDGIPVYSGQATVASVVNSGPVTVCEARLKDAYLAPATIQQAADPAPAISCYHEFFRHWSATYRLRPDYKLVIADMQSFLHGLRAWLEQLELRLRTQPDAERARLQREWSEVLAPETTAAIRALFERFEQAARKVPAEDRPTYEAFGKRHLHPLLSASPFVHRTLQKPLGYAGDFEVVNMMMRDPHEGASLFGKAVNVYALSLPPVVAHRNRIRYLKDTLRTEAARRLAGGHAMRVLSVGCGPAAEVQDFIQLEGASDRTEFTLVDFNRQTLDHVTSVLTACKQRHARNTQLRFVEQSVQHMLKQAIRPAPTSSSLPGHYDLIYCAGLYDYLGDAVCRRLGDYLYSLLAHGGLLVLTNVDEHPSRREMEYFLEWHLIYRNAPAMRTLAPAQARAESIRLLREPTGVNLLMEVRKPERD